MNLRGPFNPRPGSAAAKLFRQLSGRFREGREAVGDEAWRRWWRRMALGAAGMLVLRVTLRYAAVWALANGWLDWEAGFLLWLGSDAPLGFSTAVFLQTPGSDPTLVILIALTAGIAAWVRRPLVSLSIVLSALVPDLVGRFGWLIWSRARPDLLYEGVASPGFHAFPSGHTSKTVAVYGFLTLLWLRASGSMAERVLAILLLGVIAVVVPVGRMAMGVHWPSDVMAGFVIGTVWLAILSRADRPPAVAG
ncbi:MAG TPA: phosphatase PAP2 family protein [Longimicrobiales bacterium]|nr:phosphatase PAP2 family protein [Longimicrobiales bacterium]